MLNLISSCNFSNWTFIPVQNQWCSSSIPSCRLRSQDLVWWHKRGTHIWFFKGERSNPAKQKYTQHQRPATDNSLHRTGVRHHASVISGSLSRPGFDFDQLKRWHDKENDGFHCKQWDFQIPSQTVTECSTMRVIVQTHKLCLFQCTCLYRISKGLSRKDWALVMIMMQAQGCLSTSSIKDGPTAYKSSGFSVLTHAPLTDFSWGATRPCCSNTQQSQQLHIFEWGALRPYRAARNTSCKVRAERHFQIKWQGHLMCIPHNGCSAALAGGCTGCWLAPRHRQQPPVAEHTGCVFIVTSKAVQMTLSFRQKRAESILKGDLSFCQRAATSAFSNRKAELCQELPVLLPQMY